MMPLVKMDNDIKMIIRVVMSNVNEARDCDYMGNVLHYY